MSRAFSIRLSAALVCALLVAPAAARAGSALPSSIRGVTIGNAHVVLRGQGTVLRGSAPLGKAAELRRLGVKDVIIFKNATGSEVDREVAELRAAGYPARSILKLPFKWKDMPGFRESCGMVVDALKVIDRAYRTRGGSVFFHCTLGEDRTGMLAGLARLLETRSALSTVFRNEMCARGYELGHASKPPQVVNAIRAELTPFFLKMVNLIKSGKLRAGALSKTACSRDPGLGRLDPAAFVCARPR